MSVKEKIENLRKELHQHNYNYYVLDNPTISDFEFDEKLRELQSLEAENPEFSHGACGRRGDQGFSYGFS